MTNEEYLASECWKCNKSPTGAHHWREIQKFTDGSIHTGLFYCLWCYDSREYPTDWMKVSPYNKIGE